MTSPHTLNLPTLDETFGHNTTLLRYMKLAGFRSIVPVMLLPREALREFTGIKSVRSHDITKALASRKLGHHMVNGRMLDFIVEQFGCIEDAPIATLQVVLVYSMEITRPFYAPTYLIHFLEEIEPHMTILDLMRLGESGIRDLAEHHYQLGPILERLTSEIEVINQRLAYFSPQLKIMPVQDAPVRHLRAVGS